MTTSSVRAGGDRALLAASATLFLLFAVQAGYQKLYVNQPEYTPDPDLLAELGAATILEDDPPPSPTGDWPQWRGPRRDGVAHDPDLLTGWPHRGPKELWRVKGGGGFSSFAVGGGRVFTLLGQEGQEVVVCWEATTGKEVWRHPYATRFSDRQYGGPRSTPTLDGGRLYTVGAAGHFHCFDAATGDVLWRHDLLEEFQAPQPPWGVAFSPLVEGDLVLASPGGPGGKSVAAFHKETGKQVWTALDDQAGYSSPIALTAGGVRQVVFFTARHLVGLSPADGKVLWQYPWQTRYDVNAATPLAFRARKGGQDLDYVFLSSGYRRGCALIKIAGRGAGRFEAQRVYEGNDLCLHFSSPVRYRDGLYAIDETRDLTCLDVRTGKVLWRHRGFLQGSLLRVDDRLLVLGGDGKLALVEADPDRFRTLALVEADSDRWPSHGRCWTVPVLAGGRLYLRDEGEVLCLDLRKHD
jgi:outer membrane protein assembly factor BamB